MELKHCHNAPRVRNSIAVLSFTKTPLFAGETNQSEFFTPLLHMDTVGDAIVDTLYSGYSRTIFMPGLMRYLAWIVRNISSGHLHVYLCRRDCFSNCQLANCV